MDGIISVQLELRKCSYSKKVHTTVRSSLVIRTNSSLYVIDSYQYDEKKPAIQDHQSKQVYFYK